MNILFVILLVFVLYVIQSFVSKNTKRSPLDPPGPKWEWPILGSVHKIMNLPHRKLNHMSNTFGDGRMFKVWLGDRYTIVVSDPYLIKEIWSKNFMNFSNRMHTETARILSGNYTNLATSDYEQWKPMRALVSSAFTKSKLRSMNSLLEQQSRNLIGAMRQYANTNKVFQPPIYCKKFAMNIVLGVAFSKEIPFEDGVNAEIMDKLITPFEHMLKVTAQGNVLNFVPILTPLLILRRRKVMKGLDKCKEYIRSIYNDHLVDFDPENPRDLFDIVIAECQDSVDRVIRVSQDLILAGSDTSASTIEWFMLYMINHPEVQEKMANELKQLNTKEINLSHKSSTPYSNAVIKEILRIRPLAPLALNRCANEDFEIDGYFIPKGTQMLMNIFAVHHNEKYWPNPEKFDPDRFILQENTNNDTWIPFGVGQRNCVGLNLAMEEIYIAVCNILLNFKLSTNRPLPLDDIEVYGITTHPKPYDVILKERN